METLIKIAVLAVILALPMTDAPADDDDVADPALVAMAQAPDAFRAKVEAAGGRVDFVFEDDRPFAQCHASTIVETGDGSLLCAWFGGTKESDPDVAIWMSRFSGGAWSKPAAAAKVRQEAHWNPTLFRDPVHGLFLFFKVGVDVPQWQTYWMKSMDDGATWSTPAELVPGDVGGRGPVRSKPIILSTGEWMAPSSTEAGGWKPFVDFSNDGGATWRRSQDFSIDKAVVRGDGAIQPTLWESAPGKLHALMRTAAGFVARSDSEDGGKTWSPLYKTALPNNNSGIDVLKLDDGRLLLIYNPVGKNWGSRTPLTLAASGDNGETWQMIAHVETELGEYSYPAIVKTSKGVAISYTWRRQRVRSWQIPMATLDEALWSLKLARPAPTAPEPVGPIVYR